MGFVPPPRAERSPTPSLPPPRPATRLPLLPKAYIAARRNDSESQDRPSTFRGRRAIRDVHPPPPQPLLPVPLRKPPSLDSPPSPALAPGKRRWDHYSDHYSDLSFGSKPTDLFLQERPHGDRRLSAKGVGMETVQKSAIPPFKNRSHTDLEFAWKSPTPGVNRAYTDLDFSQKPPTRPRQNPASPQPVPVPKKQKPAPFVDLDFGDPKPAAAPSTPKRVSAKRVSAVPSPQANKFYDMAAWGVSEARWEQQHQQSSLIQVVRKN